jgi:ankyrin repeat protein
LLILIIMEASKRRWNEMGKALIGASEDGNVVVMCRFINQSADVDYVLKFMREGAEDSVTPLTQAALAGHADAVRVLISRNADVNKQEPCHGCTALHTSAQGGHAPVMQLLISKGGED